MKKLLFIIAITLAVCLPVLAVTYSAFDSATFNNAYQWTGSSKDRATVWAQDIENMALVGGALGPGAKVFYVDSGRGASGDGTSWSRAFITLDEAFASGKATADRGDYVLMAPGHNEGISTAGAIDIDVAGVTVRGIGNGSLMPTIDYDAGAATMVIGAANVRIENIRLRTSANAVSAAIRVEAAGDNYVIAGCEFGYAESAGDEFRVGVLLDAGADDGYIVGNLFKAGANSASSAVLLSAVSSVWIEDNFMYGDYIAAVVSGTTNISDNVIIKNNTIFQGTMGGDGEINTIAAIRLLEGSGGFIANNDIVSDVTTAVLMVVADDMVRFANKVSDTDGDEFSGSWEAGQGPSKVTSVSAHVDG